MRCVRSRQPGGEKFSDSSGGQQTARFAGKTPPLTGLDFRYQGIDGFRPGVPQHRPRVRLEPSPSPRRKPHTRRPGGGRRERAVRLAGTGRRRWRGLLQDWRGLGMATVLRRSPAASTHRCSTTALSLPQEAPGGNPGTPGPKATPSSMLNDDAKFSWFKPAAHGTWDGVPPGVPRLPPGAFWARRACQSTRKTGKPKPSKSRFGLSRSYTADGLRRGKRLIAQEHAQPVGRRAREIGGDLGASSLDRAGRAAFRGLRAAAQKSTSGNPKTRRAAPDRMPPGEGFFIADESWLLRLGRIEVRCTRIILV